MSFYEAMERYYDHIFPLHQNNLVFLEKKLGSSNNKHILDLACGTGTYTLALATRGFRVTGIDLDETMIELARQKKREQSPPVDGNGATFIKGDMLKLSAYLKTVFDGAFCIGNSLVHLETPNGIATALQETAAVLRRGAILIVQTVNYDRVLKHNVNSLPTLENEEQSVSFQRLYSYDAQKHRILFTGILTLPDSTSRTNTIPLYPLQKAELERILTKAGFAVKGFYGNFAGEPWSEETPATIVVAAASEETTADLQRQ